MINVRVFGDSLARGVVLDAENKKYRITGDNFVALASRGLHIAATNFSRFGSTVARVSDALSRQCGPIEPGDYMLFEVGGNDADFDWAAISADPDAEHLPNTPPEQFEAAYTELVRQSIALGAKPVLMNLPPMDPDRYFAWISRGLDAGNILKWLGGSASFIYRWHESYSQIVDNVARRAKVGLIDVRSELLRERRLPELLCADGIHLNEAGHARICAAIKRQAAGLV